MEPRQLLDRGLGTFHHRVLLEPVHGGTNVFDSRNTRYVQGMVEPVTAGPIDAATDKEWSGF